MYVQQTAKKKLFYVTLIYVKAFQALHKYIFIYISMYLFNCYVAFVFAIWLVKASLCGCFGFLCITAKKRIRKSKKVACILIHLFVYIHIHVYVCMYICTLRWRRNKKILRFKILIFF